MHTPKATLLSITHVCPAAANPAHPRTANTGHGLIREANRLDFYNRVEQHLAKHLGGRAEPAASVPGSSAQVLT
jgi:hypothetical protein